MIKVDAVRPLVFLFDSTTLSALQHVFYPPSGGCFRTIALGAMSRLVSAFKEWLRRWTQNPMGYFLTGSNRVHDVDSFHDSNAWRELPLLTHLAVKTL
jgi:hypothetical protein